MFSINRIACTNSSGTGSHPYQCWHGGTLLKSSPRCQPRAKLVSRPFQGQQFRPAMLTCILAKAIRQEKEMRAKRTAKEVQNYHYIRQYDFLPEKEKRIHWKLPKIKSVLGTNPLISPTLNQVRSFHYYVNLDIPST